MGMAAGVEVGTGGFDERSKLAREECQGCPRFRMPLRAPTRLSGKLAILHDTSPGAWEEDLLDGLVVRAGGRPETTRSLGVVWCGSGDPDPDSASRCGGLISEALAGVECVVAAGRWASRRLVRDLPDYAYRGSFYWTGEKVKLGVRTVIGPERFKTGTRKGELKPRKEDVYADLDPGMGVVVTLSATRLKEGGLVAQPLVLADFKRAVRASRGQVLVEAGEVIETGQRLDHLHHLLQYDELTLDLETAGFEGKIELVGLAPDPSFGLVLKPTPEVMEPLGKWLADPSHTLVVHNTGFDVRVLERDGFKVNARLWDTMHAAHYEQPGLNKILKPLALDTVASRMDQLMYWNWKEDFSTGANPDGAYYCGRDVTTTAYLRQELARRLERTGRLDRFERIMMPLQRVLIDVETSGVRIDTDALRKLQSRQKYIVAYLQDAWVRAHPGIDPNSSTQLKAHFYGTLGIRPRLHYKTKQPTLSREVLEELADSSEHADCKDLYELVQLRHAQKMLAYLNMPLDFRNHLHPKYNMSGTTTGRFSGGGKDGGTSGMNFQNIPKHKEDCERRVDGCACTQLRTLFMADMDHYGLAVADYSQIESRLTAYLAGEEDLLRKYDDPTFDEHQWLADILGVPRSTGKQLNHATNYGMGARELARRLKCSVRQAQQYLAAIRQAKPKIFQHRDRIHAEVVKLGYLTNRSGRRIYFQPVRKRTPRGEVWTIEASKTAAAEPQSTAGDVMHEAMLRAAQAGLQVRLQIHDELGVSMEYRDDGKILKECMEAPFDWLGGWSCRVDLGEGRTWAEAKK